MAEFNAFYNASNYQNTILPCPDRRLMLLEAHSLMTIFFSLVFDSFLLLFGLFFFSLVWIFYRLNVDHEEDLSRHFAAQYHSDTRVFVFQRHISTILYVLSAIVWNGVVRNVNVTFLWVARWSMEAALDFPTVLFTLGTPFEEVSYNRADQVYLSCINFVLLTIKLFHFGCMRAAECIPRLLTNRLLIAIFHYLCQGAHRSSQLRSAPALSFSNPCDCNDLMHR